MITKKTKVAIAVALSATMSLSAYANQTQPNIVLFLVDDMGWTDTSVQFAPERVPANDFFRTPSMEKLAKTGVKFTQAYAHAVCSPSRISLMTGQNPVRHHSSNWIMLPNGDAQNGAWGPNKSPRNWRQEGLQAGDITLPKQLKKAGYHTIHVGKAHFSAVGTEGADPKTLGFDVNIAGHSAGAPASYLGEKNFGNDIPVTDGYPQGVPGLEEYHGKPVHLTDVLTEKAENEIDNAVAEGKPFFLNMAYYAVHTPIEAHPRFIDNYRGKIYKDTQIAVPEIEARYASLVEGMDTSVGEIIQHLKDRGIAENTLIVFTSDNGGLSGHTRQTTPRGTELNTHNYPLKSGKGSAYEGGIRVPYIVSWGTPNSANPLQKKIPIKSNSVSDAQVLIDDLFPSFINIAGGEIPTDYKVDGIDVSSLWSSPDKIIERPIIMHYPHIWGPFGPGYEPNSTMRLGDYKVIYFYNSKTWEMYNLKSDIGENFNLANSEPEKLASMAKRLKDELEKMDVQWPVNRLTDKDEPLLLPKEI
ncbi:MAG: sulfatase [Vibrio sp.]|uniref:sulfatase n=1 Tax=Vibrio sp. TaxID=678 RepID=UPI003A8C79E6